MCNVEVRGIEFKYDMMALFKDVNGNMIATESRHSMIYTSHNAVVIGGACYFIANKL